MDDRSLTDKIYQELVEGLKTGLDWPHFLAEHKDSKGPTYNAIGRFLNDMGPKVEALNEVQGKLDQAGLTLDSLDQKIKEAESSLAPLEDRRNVLNGEVETLETKLAEKSEFMKHIGELEKLGFNIEMLRQLKDALTEIGAKHGLKGKEATSKFFADLKDYEAVLGAELQLKGLQAQIETRTQELDTAGKRLETIQKQTTDLQGAFATYRRLEAIGFDEKALNKLAKAIEKYGTPRKVFTALNQFTDLAKIKAIDGELRNKVKQKCALVKDLDEQYSHLKEPIELCKRLIKRRFGLQALSLINHTAWRYGEPTEVMKAIEAYGALKEIKKETDQARTVLAEIKGKAEAEKETYAEYSARNSTMLDQFEALTAKAIETGRIVGGVQEQLKKDTLARDLLTLLHNPSSASYKEYVPLVLVLLRVVTVWAIMNRSKFSYPSLIDKNLQEVVGYLGGS